MDGDTDRAEINGLRTKLQKTTAELDSLGLELARLRSELAEVQRVLALYQNSQNLVTAILEP